MEQKPKLLDQVRAVARARHLSHRTEDTYHNFIKRFILFHNKRHLSRAGPAAPFVFFAFDKIVLKPIPARVTALPF